MSQFNVFVAAARSAGLQMPVDPNSFHASEAPHLSTLIFPALYRTNPFTEDQILTAARRLSEIPEHQVINLTFDQIESFFTN